MIEKERELRLTGKPTVGPTSAVSVLSRHMLRMFGWFAGLRHSEGSLGLM